MKNIYILLSLLVLHVCLTGIQAQNKIKPLAIGDTLPELAYHQVINYHQDSVKLSDFKGKLLILDFWNTWCVACLASFPKLTGLQQKYQDKIVIMPVVTHQGGNKEKYLDFFNNRAKMGMPINLPSIVEDTVLLKLFPHKSVPRIVWIASNGEVRGATYGMLNEENIQNMLSDSNFNFPIEKDKPLYENIEISKPLSVFSENSLTRKSILGRNVSLSVGGRNNVSIGLTIKRDSLFTRVTVINTSLPSLFISLFKHRFKNRFNDKSRLFAYKHVFIESDNKLIKSEFTFHNNKSREKYKNHESNSFTYELQLEGNISDEKMFEAMHDDLNVSFAVQASLEKRPILHYELFVKNEKMITRSKFEKERGVCEITNIGENQQIICVNLKLSTLVSRINSQNNMPFIFNETNILEGVDLDISWKSANIHDLNKQLANYGLGLRKKKTRMEVVVIR